MIAIHHIIGLKAIRSAFDNSNYLTLQFTNRHGEAGLPPVRLTLYFESPIRPGELWALCDAINRTAPDELTPDLEQSL